MLNAARVLVVTLHTGWLAIDTALECVDIGDESELCAGTTNNSSSLCGGTACPLLGVAAVRSVAREIEADVSRSVTVLRTFFERYICKALY